jgi:hypothetical protein
VPTAPQVDAEIACHLWCRIGVDVAQRYGVRPVSHAPGLFASMRPVAIGTGEVLEAEVDYARRRGPYYPDASALDPGAAPGSITFRARCGMRYEVYSL